MADAVSNKPVPKSAWRSVTVDSKEITNHLEWYEDSELAQAMPGTFAHEAMRVTVKPLEYGDVHVTLSNFKRCIVELKTWEDLHAAVRDRAENRADSRIRHQMAGLLELQKAGHDVWVMVVGIITPAGGKTAPGARPKGVYTQHGVQRRRQNWSFFEAEQIRAEIQSLGIRVYQCPSTLEIPHAVRLLVELAERPYAFPQPGLPTVKALSPRLSFCATQLTGVDGIGTVTALAIADRFKTFGKFLSEGTVEELTKLPGIGKHTAMKIHAAFHDFEADPEVTIDQVMEARYAR